MRGSNGTDSRATGQDPVDWAGDFEAVHTENGDLNQVIWLFIRLEYLIVNIFSKHWLLGETLESIKTCMDCFKIFSSHWFIAQLKLKKLK